MTDHTPDHRPSDHRPSDHRPSDHRPSDRDQTDQHLTNRDLTGRDLSDRHLTIHRAPQVDGLPMSVWMTAQDNARVQRRGRYLPESVRHPGKMLPAIARHAITTYTAPGDLVLDPMCGIGTTLVEAVHLGRNAIGIEYEQQWATMAEANLDHAHTQGATGQGRVVTGDARDAVDLLGWHLPQTGWPAEAWLGHVALVVTSPPYGASTHGHIHSTKETGRPGVEKFDTHYGHDPNNLAHTGLETLLDGLATILRRCHTLLRPGGHVVITTRPYRVRGELIDLPSAVIAAAQQAGLVLTERCVALLGGIHRGRLIARPSFFQLKNIRTARRNGTPQHLIVHEDVLVFTKPGGAAGCTAPSPADGPDPTGPNPTGPNPTSPNPTSSDQADSAEALARHSS